jgi:Flp pilus assembly protein TadD
MNSSENLHRINVELLFREGQEFLNHHAFGKALELFNRASDLKPNDPSVHFFRGLALGKLGRWQESANAYLEVLRLQPDHTEAHVNLGFVYYEMSLDTEAQASFERADDLGGLAKFERKVPF